MSPRIIPISREVFSILYFLHPLYKEDRVCVAMFAMHGHICAGFIFFRISHCDTCASKVCLFVFFIAIRAIFKLSDGCHHYR
jgi:hypothetical protein